MWLQLGLKFPKADGAAAIIDTSLYDAGTLTPGPNTAGPYPLVVRLETVTAKGLADGHTLQVCQHLICHVLWLPLSPCCCSSLFMLLLQCSWLPIAPSPVLRGASPCRITNLLECP